MSDAHRYTVPWTPEMDEMLRSLWTSGLTCTEIGKKIGKTKSAITGRAHRLSLPQRPSPIKSDRKTWKNKSSTLSMMQRIRKIVGQGVVDPEKIGAEVGLPRNSVVTYLNRLGQHVGRRGAGKVSARVTQWKRVGEEEPPFQLPVYEIDEKQLMSGVGGSRKHCQFIPKDPQGANTLYCGCQPAENSPYCEAHRLVCYRPHPLQAKVSNE